MIAKAVKWTDRVNLLGILCQCGHKFWTRLDRWTVRCPSCQATESIIKLRNQFVVAVDH